MNHNKRNFEKYRKNKNSPVKMKSFSSNFVLILLVVLASKCETSDFIATNEWQDIQEGQKVPAGLHYRMNLATGKKEAKLLVEENDAESDTG